MHTSQWHHQQEVNELEERYTSNFTTEVLSVAEPEGSRTCHNQTRSSSTTQQYIQVSLYLCLIAELIGWEKLWDLMLDHGPCAMSASLMETSYITYNVYAYHGFSGSWWPLGLWHVLWEGCEATSVHYSCWSEITTTRLSIVFLRYSGPGAILTES